jgi:ABC-type transporter Mla maintaining outer membrane lipid asymmetry ATPase subunit MlaF
MICFSEVIAHGIDSPVDFILSAGESAAVITSRAIENDAIVKVILGFLPTIEGSFTLYDERPAFLKESEISVYRKKIGVIYNDGGFISNLNLWENLTLQIAFEGVLGKKEIEELGMSALERVGYSGSPSVLVSRLSLFQRRQVAFARATLANPCLMIYHSTFDGLSRSEQKHLSNLAWEYHEAGDKTSLFLTSYPESLKGMNFNLIYNTGGTSSI